MKLMIPWLLFFCHHDTSLCFSTSLRELREVCSKRSSSPEDETIWWSRNHQTFYLRQHDDLSTFNWKMWTARWLCSFFKSIVQFISRSPKHLLSCSDSPCVGEAVPQALTVTPEQSVEDAVEEPVEVEALHIRLPPDPMQRRADVGAHNVQNLRDGDNRRGGREQQRPKSILTWLCSYKDRDGRSSPIHPSVMGKVHPRQII